MREIVKTDYPGLVRLMYSSLRFERKIPYRDNFLLLRDIGYNERMRFDRFQNFVVLSKQYFEVEWGRAEILDQIKKMIGSRRKPQFEQMSDDEFENTAKVFLLTGYWPPEEDTQSMIELFKKVDSFERFALFFKLKEDYHVKVLFYALLTFSGKIMDLNPEGVSSGYLRVLKSKERVVKQNFLSSLNNYSKYTNEVDDELKILRFIHDLGQVTL